MSSQNFDEAAAIWPLWQEPGTGTGLYLDDQRLENGNVVSIHDNFTLRYDFEMGEEDIAAIFSNPDKRYEIPVPQGLEWRGAPGTFYVEIQEGLETYQLGYAFIEEGTAYFVFEGDFWEPGHSLVQVVIDEAYFKLPCGWTPEVQASGEPSADLEFLGGDQLQLYLFENQASQHEALLEVSDFADHSCTWTVTFTPGTVPTDYPLTLVASWDNWQHVLIPESLEIIGSEQTISLNHEPGQSELSLVLSSYSPEPITITFQTRLADDLLQANLSRTTANHVELYMGLDVIDDQQLSILAEPLTEHVTAHYQYRIMSEKIGTQSGRGISWTIRLYVLDRLVDNFSLADFLPAGLKLTGVTVTDLDGDTLDAAVWDEEQFTITFPKPTSATGYQINLTSVIDDTFFDGSLSQVFQNIADWDFDWARYGIDGYPQAAVPSRQSPKATVTLSSQVVSKQGLSYNRATREITWQLNLNPYKVDLQSLTLTENLGGGSYPSTYVAGSFSTSQPGLVQLAETGPAGEYLVIDVGNLQTSSATVTFKATVDDPDYFAGNFPYDSNHALTSRQYINTLDFDAAVQIFDPENIEEPYSVWEYAGSSSAAISLQSRMLDKEGASYDVGRRRAAWQLALNHNNLSLEQVRLEEAAGPGQTFDPASITIPGLELDTDYFVVLDAGDTLLTITFPFMDSKTMIYFETLVAADEIAAFWDEPEVTLTNSAQLFHDDGPAGGVADDAQLLVANTLLAKDGEFDATDKLIRYQVRLNPHGLTLTDAFLFDQIPAGLQLDITSVALFQAILDAAGTFTKGSQLASFDDPAFEYGLNSFQLSLPLSQNAYILEFDCYVTQPGLKTFVNVIELQDEAADLQTEPAAATDTTVVDNSGQGVSSKRVKLTLTKHDALRPGLKLAGARLNLYQTIGSSGIKIMEAVTDADGLASFYPLKQGIPYFIEEEQAQGLLGYDLPVWLVGSSTSELTISPYTGHLERLNLQIDVEGNEIFFDLGNMPVMGDVDFTKTTDRGATGAFLPMEAGEAAFQFSDQTPGSSFLTGAAIGLSGVLQVTGLPFGVYQATETTTPPYHTAHGNFSFEISPTGLGLGTTADLPNTYFRPDFPLLKTDADTSAGLSGASFELALTSGPDPHPGPAFKTTSPTGLLTFEALYGGSSYEITETPPAGYYQTPPLAVPTVSQAANFSLTTWKNYAHAAKLTVTLVDDMRQGVKLPGGSFELYDVDPAVNLTAQPLATATTSSLGTLTFTDLVLEQNVGGTLLNQEPALLPTTYWLVQTAAPTGYLLPADPIFDLLLDPAVGMGLPRTRTYVYQAENDPVEHDEVSLSFYKYTTKSAPYTYDAGASLETPLAGIRFKLLDQTAGSDYALFATSDGTGRVYFENIPFGRYRLTEVDAGGSPARVPYHQTWAGCYVDFDEDGICTAFNGMDDPQPAQFFLVNEIHRNNLVITKTRANGTTPIAGALFELCDETGASFPVPIYSSPTDGTGKTTFTNLIGGHVYTVRETSAPDGFYVSAPYLTLRVDQSGPAYEFTWRNYEFAAGIDVDKFDSRPGSVRVSGAKYTLYPSQPGEGGEPEIDLSRPLGTETTGLTGKISFNGLLLDQDLANLPAINTEPNLLDTCYWLVEIAVGEGYTVDGTPQKVLLTGGLGRTQRRPVSLLNTPHLGGFTFLKYTDRDPGALLEGAVFTLADQTASSLFTATGASQPETGQVAFVDLPFGLHLLTETGVPDYHQPLLFEVVIAPDGSLESFNGTTPPPTELEIVNTIKKTSLTLTKKDALGVPLAGLPFALYRVLDETEVLITSGSTNGSGILSFDGLMGGESYVVYETATAPGYYISGSYALTIAQELARTQPATALIPYSHQWINYSFETSILVTVTDEMRPEVLLAGAVFSLYRGDELGPDTDGGFIESLTSDANGMLQFKHLEMNQGLPASTTTAEPQLLETIYWLVQTLPASGYLPMSDPLKVLLDPTAAAIPRTHVYPVSVVNDPAEHERIDLHFVKYSDKSEDYVLGLAPLAGVSFTLRDLTTHSQLTRSGVSDAYGVVAFEDIPFGDYALEENSAALFHHKLDPVSVSFEADGTCGAFNGISDPAGSDFMLVNEVFKSSLTITKVSVGQETPMAGVEFALCDADGQELGQRQVTDALGQATFRNLYGGDVYTVKEIANPQPGHYITGTYALVVAAEMNYLYLWKNFAHEASVKVSVVDAFRQDQPVAGSVLQLFANNSTGTGPLEPPLATAVTDELGQVIFTGLALNQLLPAADTSSEPELLETTFWVMEWQPAPGYALDPLPVAAVFADPGRRDQEELLLLRESLAPAALSVSGGNPKVLPGEALLFDEISSENGKISYDGDTGEITFTCEGIYYITWFVAAQTGLSADRNNFALQKRDGQTIGSSHFIGSQTRGFAIVEALLPGETVKLINVSSRSVTLSKKTLVKSDLTILKVGDIPAAPEPPLGGLQLCLGSDPLHWEQGQGLIFTQLVGVPLNTAKVDYDPSTGRFYLGPGIFLFKWSFSLHATDYLPAIRLHLRSTVVENTWTSYYPLPLGILEGSALVVSHQPLEILYFTSDEGNDTFLLDGLSQVTVTQIHHFPPAKSCL